MEDSVDDSEVISWSVSEELVDAAAWEVTGAELVQAGSGRLVLDALTLRGGVESEVPSDVELR